MGGVLNAHKCKVFLKQKERFSYPPEASQCFYFLKTPILYALFKITRIKKAVIMERFQKLQLLIFVYLSDSTVWG